MNDWAAVLHHVAPRAHAAVVDEIAPHLDALNDWPALVQAHFVAQAAEETAGFTTLIEIGGKSYFRRYDGRRDLGNIYPGDGYKFRGRGIFQTTGRYNYAQASKRRGVDLIKHPELAATGQIAVANALDFWESRGCTRLAEHDNVAGVTRKINGGTNGLTARRAYLLRAKHILGIAITDGPEPLHPEKVKAIQHRLKSLGYHMVGKADGGYGSSTTAGVAAFQHDQDLPITGQVDDATEAAVWSSDEQRPISDERANGQPVGSRIYNASQTMFVGAGLTGVSSVLDQAETAQSYVTRVHDLAQPLLGHPGLIAIVASIVVGGLAWTIRQARIADYQSGKTP